MFDHMVNHYKRVKHKGVMVNKLVAHTPYLCITMGKPPKKFYLRDGVIHFSDGKALDPKDVPKEVMEICRAQTDDGKKMYGVPKGA